MFLGIKFSIRLIRINSVTGSGAAISNLNVDIHAETGTSFQIEVDVNCHQTSNFFFVELDNCLKLITTFNENLNILFLEKKTKKKTEFLNTLDNKHQV